MRTTTPDLFSFVRARTSDPQTSHQAGQRTSDELRAAYKRVLAVHKAHPRGLTDHEMSAMIRGLQTSYGKRRGELRDMGMIEDSHERRPAPSGSSAIVWRITKAGMEAAT